MFGFVSGKDYFLRWGRLWRNIFRKESYGFNFGDVWFEMFKRYLSGVVKNLVIFIRLEFRSMFLVEDGDFRVIKFWKLRKFFRKRK